MRVLLLRFKVTEVEVQSHYQVSKLHYHFASVLDELKEESICRDAVMSDACMPTLVQVGSHSHQVISIDFSLAHSKL